METTEEHEENNKYALNSPGDADDEWSPGNSSSNPSSSWSSGSSDDEPLMSVDSDLDIDIPDEILTLEDARAVYPIEIIDEIAYPEQQDDDHTSLSSRGFRAAVYVVTLWERSSESIPEFKLMGTYSTAEAANMRVLSVFHSEYPQFTDILRGESELDPDVYQCHWFMDSDKALQLHAREEDSFGYYSREVRATKQLVEDNGLVEKEGVNLCDT